MAEPPAPDRAVPVQGPHHRVLIPPDLCLEETIDALQASLSEARVANSPEQVPLRRLVPKAGGHWRRCLGAGELLRAVASRDEVVLRCVLGGSADSPRLPVPPAPIFELLRTDDRGRCALDWARLMGWSEAVGLLTEAMQKALAACQEQAAEEQGLLRAAELVRANLQLSSALQAACGNSLDDEWAEATLATLERAARSGVSAAELAEAQQRLRRAGPEAAASALRRCATGRPLTPDPSAEETDGDIGVSSQHFVHASNRWVGQSPLDRAAACGRADVAEALLLAGAIASEPGQDGRLPLGTACASGHLVVCRLLVKHGANPFQADPASGQTPLMHANKAGREDVTQWLLGLARDSALQPSRGIAHRMPHPFARPTHWGEAVLEALDTADDGGLTCLDFATREAHGSRCAELVRRHHSQAARAVEAWRRRQHGSRWHSCPRCGDRVLNQDAKRHAEQLCVLRPHATPRRRPAGVEGMLPPLASLVQPHQLHAVVSRLRPEAYHRPVAAVSSGDGAGATGAGREASVADAGTSGPPTVRLPGSYGALAKTLAARAATLNSGVESQSQQPPQAVPAKPRSLRLFASLEPSGPDFFASPDSSAMASRRQGALRGASAPLSQVRSEAMPEASSCPRSIQQENAIRADDASPAKRGGTSASEFAIDCPLGCGHALPNPEAADFHASRRCDLRLISCSLGCGQFIQARDVILHESHECPERSLRCSCGAMVRLKLRPLHLAEKCPRRSVLCPDHCGVRIEARHLESHRAESCQQALVDCPLGCGNRVPRRSIDSHVESTCPRRNVACPFGCGQAAEASLIGVHARLCPKRHVRCRFGCGETDIAACEMPEHEALCECRPVHCPRGCGFTAVPVFPRSATEIMETHIQESCPRRLVPCSRGCGQSIAAASMEVHEQTECAMRIQPCPRGCGASVHASALRFHSAVCDFRVLDCEFQCASCQRRLRSWLLGPYGNARMQLCPLHGSSPLHCAAAKGDLDLLALLVRFVRDAELEVVNMQGLTPLALACRKGQPGAVRMLLAAGADALTESPRGITPLACAVEGSDVDCARLLLEAGASPLTPNSRGLSAAGLAERLGRGGLVQAFNVHSRVRVNLAAMHRAVLRRDALGLGLLLGDLRSRRRAREVQEAPQATAVEGPAENVPSVPPAAVLKREEGGQSRFVPVWRLEREAEAARDGLETATRDACRSIAALAVFHQTSRASGVTAERAEACSRPAAGSRASSLAHLHLAQPIGGERVHSRLRDERNMRVLEQAVAERTRLRMKASRCSETAEQREFGARILRERTPLRHTLLSFASACGATDCMRLLLQMGASPEFDERVWHAAASVIQTAWRATSAARLAAEAWMPPPRARVVRFRALFAGKQALRIASLQLRRELREARLPLHEAAFAGRPAAVQLLLEAGAQPWRRCQALPEPPPPMAMPRQLVMPAPAAGSGGQTRQAEDVLVRVPRLRSDGRIRPEDDVHGWRDKVVVPQLDFGSLSLSSFESSPWASCHDASDSRSSALPSHQAHEEAAVAASAPSGTGLVTKAMQDGKVGCVTLPRAMFIAETAALGYARLGHRTFVYGDGWDRLDGHMAAIGKALEALRHHTLSRRRAAEACRLARNRRERVAELRRLRAVFSVAIDTSDADSVLACLKQGLPAETTDADSGHNALTMAAAQGCSVVSPASNTRRLLVDVILEEFATDPLGLLNHQAPNGLTPLMAAAARGQDSALVALLRRRPGLNAVASCRHPREDVDQLDRAAPGWGLPWRLVTGATALHAAARFGSSGCVRLLQIAGANSAARTDAGDTPADLARRHGHSATAEVLRAAETGTAVNETSRLLAHGPAAVSPCEWGCGARFTAAEASHHDRECPRRIVPCPLGCEEAGIFACEVVEHCKTACPRRRARCPFGCPEVIPGSQFESHLLQCPRRRGAKHVPSTGGSSRPSALEGLG